MNSRILELKPARPAFAWSGRNIGGILRTLWYRILRIAESRPRRLRLVENLPLGERRFVAVIEYEQARFLLGGTASTLVLLSQLTDRSPSPNEAETQGPTEIRP